MTVGPSGNPYTRITSDVEGEAGNLRTSSLSSSEAGNGSSERIVVAAFFLLGIGVLLPWNALLAAIDYYAMLFPNLSVVQYITNAYTFPFMVMGTLAALFPNLSRHRRSIVSYSFVVLTISTAVLPTLSSRDDSILNSAEALISKELWLTVTVSAILGGVGAVLQSVLFGTVTILPGGKCTVAFTAGGGLASVFICTLRIICRLVLDRKDSGSLQALLSGFQVFLLTCAGLCAACVIVFLWLDRHSPYYREHVSSADVPQVDDSSKTFLEILGDARVTLREIARPAFCALTSFTVTLGLFPGILVQIPTPLRVTVSPTLSSWYPLIVVSLFAIGDTVGRGGLTERVAVRFPSILPTLTVLRVICVPVYLLQWIGIVPIYWIVVMVMVVMLGVGNGLIVTLAFLSVPSLAAAERREVAGRLMFVMLICGMSVGNMVGWALEAMLRSTTAF